MEEQEIKNQADMSRRAIFVHASLVVFLCLWAGFVYFQHSKLQEYTDYDYGLTNSVSESGMPLRLKFTNTSKLQLEDLDWFLHVCK